MRTIKLDGNSIVKVLIYGFFVVFLFFPLLKLFLHFSDEGIAKVSAGYIQSALIDTMMVGVVSSLLSVVLGLSLAYFLLNTKTKMRDVLIAVFTLPMLVPTVAHGSGLILIFGNNGILTRFFHTSSHIYGFWGCVLGFVFCTFPIAFLMFWNVLKYEDKRQYEVADILGVSKPRQFTGITLPYIFKSATSILCAIFALIISDYGIPLMVGGQFKTLALIMYSDVIGLSKNNGSAISILLLCIALVALWLEFKNKTKPEIWNAKYETNTYIDSRKFKIFSKVYLTGVALFIVFYLGVFMVAAFSKEYSHGVEFSLGNFSSTFSKSGIRYLRNSAAGAFWAAVLGTALAYFFAYYSTRVKDKTKAVHILSISTAVIPGIVLGLGYVLSFKGTPVYGTTVIIIIINMVHFFAPAYLLAYNALLKISKNVEAIGAMYGLGRCKVLKDVIVPTTSATILDMFSYFFVNSMITISAVSFLSNMNSKPLSLMIPQYENQQQLGNVAVVALVILAVNLLLKVAIWGFKGKKRRGARPGDIVESPP